MYGRSFGWECRILYETSYLVKLNFVDLRIFRWLYAVSTILVLIFFHHGFTSYIEWLRSRRRGLAIFVHHADVGTERTS